MGIIWKKGLAGALIAAGLWANAGLCFAGEQASVEQVYVNLPEITVYGDGIQETVLEGYLGQENLQMVSAEAFSDTAEPIYYYVLLDVSNSMPESYFEAVKQSISSFEATLGENDRMILYTFGEQVKLVLDESHQRSETAAVLAGIDNTDNKTLLFDAVSQAAEYADQVPASVCRRRILAVISDGEDFTVGGTGAQEAQQNLLQKGLPAYAFAIADTARENINSFGEFARMSGGKLTVFDAQQASAVLENFHHERMETGVLELRADSNVASNRMETFALKLQDNRSLTKEVMVSRHIPDQQAPIIQNLELTEEGQLKLTFSEPVQGAENAAGYAVVCGEYQAVVIGVSVSQEQENTMILTFDGELKPGTYTVRCNGITDISMEKNSVSNTMEFAAEEPSVGEKLLLAAKEWYWAVLALAAVILAAAGWAGYRKIKKGRGVLYVDGKPVMASDVEVHHHVEIQDEEGLDFQVQVRVKGGPREEMNLRMKDSFIVGRSQICNLYFDDKRMSRQHFVLEWDGEGMYVTDLDTTNGTLVNDVKITKRRRLNPGDKVSAGSVDMVIRW